MKTRVETSLGVAENFGDGGSSYHQGARRPSDSRRNQFISSMVYPAATSPPKLPPPAAHRDTGSDDDDDDDVSGNSNSGDDTRYSTADQENTSVDDHFTYITVETQDGKLEQLKVSVDDSNFGTTDHIVKYLVENNGEILQNNPTIKAIRPTQRRGSLFKRRNSGPSVSAAVCRTPTGAATPGGGVGGGGGNVSVMKAANKALDLEGQLSRDGRQGSIVTPNLISNLKRNKQRLVAKGGQCNLHLKNVHKKRRQFLRDMFTTAIDMSWRYTLLAFASSFFVSWLIFAVIYWLIALARGDFLPEHLPAMQAQSGWTPCIFAIEDFTSCYLFSVETQHTIGYGSRQTTEKCPEAVIMMSLQSVLGVVISSCMAGIVFAKLARPKHRSHTVMFSKNAVVTMRNGDLYLLFRVGNLRKSHLIEAHVRAVLVHHKRSTREGETVTFDHEELTLSTEMKTKNDDVITDDVTGGSDSDDSDGSTEDRAFMMWPVTVSHRIDKHSPMYGLGPKELLSAKFEMVVSLEGIVEPTGNSVQARTSYLPNELLWGHRFQNMMSYKKKTGVYTVDFSYLNAVTKDETPRISAKHMDARRRQHGAKAAGVASIGAKGDAIGRGQLKPAASPDTVSEASLMDKTLATSISESSNDQNSSLAAAANTTVTMVRNEGEPKRRQNDDNDDVNCYNEDNDVITITDQISTL